MNTTYAVTLPRVWARRAAPAGAYGNILRLGAAVGLAVGLGAGGQVLPTVAARVAAVAAAPTVAADNGAAMAPTPPVRAAQAHNPQPLSFEPNVGQAGPGADFVARGSGYRLALGATGVTLATAAVRTKPSSVLRMTLVGADPMAAAQGQQPLAGRVNYLSGQDPARWHTSVPTFAQVAYRNVYPGIGAVYHGTNGHLEYDFHVAPGADPAVIGLRFEGSEASRVDANGDLVLTTPSGELRQHAPVLYQQVGARRVSVAGRFVLDDGGRVGFSFGAFDHNRPLVIDPSVVFSTYLGGTSDDGAEGVATDSAANVYVTGITGSADFPVTTGAFQTNATVFFAGYITKYDAAGAVVYSTYFAGNNQLRPMSIAVDSSGDAVVGGFTNATDFPTTPNAFQAHPVGSPNWGFVAKLNPTGSGLLYSSFVGDQVEGVSVEGGQQGIALDGSNGAYFTTDTSAPDYPTTPGAFQGSLKGGTDMVVTKLDLSASGAASLVYSTYVGGSGGEQGRSIAVDPSGAASVDGLTFSSDFPVTAGAVQSALKGGGDLFVFKLNPTGTALVYSTYLGGSNSQGDPGADSAGIAVDTSGDTYVTSGSNSTDFPTTAGAYQTSNKGGWDAVAAKFDSSGHLIYSTYLGGAMGDDSGVAVAAGPDGTAFVIGDTGSSDFPTANPTQASYGGGGDVFVSQLNPAGSALEFSTYLGGSGNDAAYNVAFSKALAVSGATTSADFPTVHPAQPTAPGNGDSFVTSYSVPDLLRLSKTASPNLVLGGHRVTYTMTVANDGSVGPASGVTLTDPLPAGMTFVSANPSQGTCSQSAGTVTCGLGTVAPNADATVAIIVTAPNRSVMVVNTATVSANETDPFILDNTASATVFVNPADLSITNHAPIHAVTGQPFNYTLGVANAGPVGDTTVTVTDRLPTDVAVQSITTTNGTCNRSGVTITCQLGPIGRGARATITIAVVIGPIAPPTGSFSNVASVSGNLIDPKLSNNTAIAQTSVSGPGCGQVITKNLTVPAPIGPCPGVGLIIGADNITIDLGGYQLVGSAAHKGNQPGIDIEGHRGVTIENGSVSGFDAGVFINLGGFETIEGLKIHDNVGPNFGAELGDGIAVFHSPSNKILNNALARNGPHSGIGVYGVESDTNVIQGNTITGSVASAADHMGGAGIVVTAVLEPNDARRGLPIDGNNIMGNVVTGNEGVGIWVVSNINAQISSNAVMGNGLDRHIGPRNGIQVSFDKAGGADPAVRDTVQHNKVKGNGDNGILIASHANHIIGNTTDANNANNDHSFDLKDVSANCDSNVWSANTWGSGGFNQTCVTAGGP